MKKAVFLVLIVLSALSLFSQEETNEKGFQKNKLFVGGNFGLTFGDYTLINISPLVGYRFNSWSAAGMGLNAQYLSVKERYNGEVYRKTSQGVVGLNVFGRLYPIQQLMIQAQPEVNYIFGDEIYYQPTRQQYKMDAQIVPSLLLGGGIVFPSGKGAFIASILYDVLENPNSPYGKQPIINFSFNIGL
jgi:hypothetical protein